MYKLALDHLLERYAFHGDGRIVEDFINSIKDDLEWNESKTLEFLNFGKSNKSCAMDSYRIIQGDKGLEEFRTELYEKYRAFDVNGAA